MIQKPEIDFTEEDYKLLEEAIRRLADAKRRFVTESEIDHGQIINKFLKEFNLPTSDSFLNNKLQERLARKGIDQGNDADTLVFLQAKILKFKKDMQEYSLQKQVEEAQNIKH